MWKVSPVALVLLCLVPDLAKSVEIKNVRSTFGRPYGAIRSDNKVLPGEPLFLMFDIEGLKMDEKTGEASYEIGYGMYDNAGKEIVGKKTPQTAVLELRGGRVPGEAYFVIGPKQAPGKYKVKLSVTDRLAKVTKDHEYGFEILKPGFGVWGVQAPAFAIPGQKYIFNLSLVNMELDPKKKTPKVEVSVQVLDDAGKVLSIALKQKFPPLPSEVDLQKENWLPILCPAIYLNRPGNFVIAVDAEDKLGKRKASLRIPLTVLDLANLGVSGK
jgi:hypothetical protein